MSIVVPFPPEINANACRALSRSSSCSALSSDWSDEASLSFPLSSLLNFTYHAMTAARSSRPDFEGSIIET